MSPRKNAFLVLLVLILGGFETLANNNNKSSTIAPLRQLDSVPRLLRAKYSEFPLGSIQPNGWLLKQLERMAAGMTGNLDELYPSVLGERNGWLGGDGDGWERGPYWIDGLLPLAYILKDSALIAKANKWVEWTIANQQENGYIGPVPFLSPPPYEPGLQRGQRRDWWPKMVMLKILQQHYNATKDERVLETLRSYFKYQLKELPERPLDTDTFWANRRGGDNLMVVLWLYDLSGETFLLDLAEVLVEQTFPWTQVFTNPPNNIPVTGLGEYFRIKKYPFDSSQISTINLADEGSIHTVNLAQGLKQPALAYQLSGDSLHLLAIGEALKTIKKYHGQVQGMYGGDEPLHGNNPVQGVEFCSISEMMFSLETIIKISGDMAMADQLERITYNALPTQATDDYRSRQYFQAANQVELREYSGVSYENHNHKGTDFVMGLLTGYPCCTTNMHQSWPKFVQNLFYSTSDGGIAAIQYAPSTAIVKLDNKHTVRIKEETGYPFRDQIHFTFNMDEDNSFPFHLRIPEWAATYLITINGELSDNAVNDHLVVLNRTWKDGDIVSLTLPMEVEVTNWYDYSSAIERGPLVYGLKIKEEQVKKDRGDQYGSFTEFYPKSAWNYGLLKSELEKISSHVEVVENAWDEEYPWNHKNAPVEIRMTAVLMPEWQAQNGVPHLPAFWGNYKEITPDQRKQVTLLPYGCTTLRISQFPTLRD